MKTILVTGGAGFIGSHLCKRLIVDGNRVICMDNLKSGSVDNISDLFDDDEFLFIDKDIVLEDIYKLRQYNIDEIYNLACPASPKQYQKDPLWTTMSCTRGVYNMLGLATISNAKILQASTSEVYGNPSVHPQNEEYFGNVNPCGIRSCYDEGKRCAESLFFDFHRKYGTKIKVIRIFNTYGENMANDDGRVISNFIVQALTNESLTIYGDGKQTRSFQYVSDLIDGMIKMMESDDKITGPINIGNPQEYTIQEIAKMIIKKTNSSSEITYQPLPNDDPSIRKPDITKAKELLDWSPKVDIDDGLKKTISYFKDKVFLS